MDLHLVTFMATLLAEVKRELFNQLFIAVYLPCWEIIKPHTGRAGEGLGKHVTPDW